MMEFWRKKNRVSDPAATAYGRLAAEGATVAEGYVPVIVGRRDDGSDAERFAVPVKLFKKRCVKELLDDAAVEFGYRQEGILRIPCDVEQFREVCGRKLKCSISVGS